MPTIYKKDENTGKLVPFKTIDNGDGTFSESGSSVSGGSVAIDQTTDNTTNAVRVKSGGSLTAKNGTITTGGTAQQLAAANSARRYFMVQNQSNADLYISFTGTAVADKTSMKLAAGDSYETPTGFVPTQAISIIGATTGQAFYAVEG